MYLNLAVKDLKKSMNFFSKVGFKFNPKFTDDNATCMIIGDNIYVMLLVEKFFKTFIKKKISNAKDNTEAIIGIGVESRKEVDEMVNKAVKAGGKLLGDAKDHGFMYTRSFEDLDGHIWEIFYFDESKFPKKEKKETLEIFTENGPKTIKP